MSVDHQQTLLLSRQFSVFGANETFHIENCRLLIVGCNGLGNEVAKNLIMAGVKNITLFDPKGVEWRDLSSLTFLDPITMKSRAKIVMDYLKDLSPKSNVKESTAKNFDDLCDVNHLREFTFVVCSGYHLTLLTKLNQSCRHVGIPFICCDAKGVSSYVFEDLGDSYTYTLDDGKTNYETCIPIVDFKKVTLVNDESTSSSLTYRYVVQCTSSLSDGVIVSFDQVMERENSIDMTFVSNQTIPTTSSAPQTFDSGNSLSVSNVSNEKQDTITCESSDPIVFEPLSEVSTEVRDEEMKDVHHHVFESDTNEECKMEPIKSFRLPLGQFKVTNTTKNSFVFECDAEINPECYQGGCFLKMHREQRTASFKPLKDLIDPTITGSQYFYYNRRKPIDNLQLLCLMVFDKFVEKFGRSPLPWNSMDCNQCQELCCNLLESYSNQCIVEDLKGLEGRARLFFNTCSSNIHPLNAMIGGLVAQETLKSITRKYSPLKDDRSLNQFLFIDNFNLGDELNEHVMKQNVMNLTGTIHEGVSPLLTEQSITQLNNMNILVAGAGAVGCEVLKNLSSMMSISNESPNIFLVDYDRVAPSNLHRQLLFRDSDANNMEFKSIASSRILKKMNPHLNWIPITEKLSYENEETLFNEEFWNNLSVIFSCVDSKDARSYLSDKSQILHIPMFEGGTEGSKGSSLIIHEHVAGYQSYNNLNASRDEENMINNACIPSFAIYKPEQAIRKAVELFTWFFKENVQVVNQIEKKHLSHEHVKNTLNMYGKGIKNPESMSIKLFNIIFKDQIIQAALQYNHNVNDDDVKQLLRKPPTPEQDLDQHHNQYHSRFIHSSNMLIKQLKVQNKKLIPILFEKDDPIHLEWIVACSVLIAKCYGIPHSFGSNSGGAGGAGGGSSDREFVRRVAGQIIPAIITTTSMVSGFMCLGLFKYVQNGYKNLSNLDFNTANNGYSFQHVVQKLKCPVPGKKIQNFEKVNEFIIYPFTLIREWIEFVKNKFDIVIDKLTISPQFCIYDFGCFTRGESFFEAFSKNRSFQKKEWITLICETYTDLIVYNFKMQVKVSTPLHLENVEGSCYLNSALQVLHSCHEFVEALRVSNPTSHVAKVLKSIFESKFSKSNINELRRLTNRSNKYSGDTPKYVRSIFSEIIGDEQEDSELADCKLVDYFSWKNPQINDICQNCNHCIKGPVRPSSSQVLLLQGSSNISTSDLLNSSFKFDSNKKCEKCGGKVFRHKTFDTFPHYLLCEIETPQQKWSPNIAIEPRVFVEECEYELVSGAIYSGNRHGGHWRAYSKQTYGWFNCDDSFISYLGMDVPNDNYLKGSAFLAYKKVLNNH